MMKVFKKLNGGEDGNLNKGINPYNIDFYYIKLFLYPYLYLYK
jgi:hypothetical protein